MHRGITTILLSAGLFWPALAIGQTAPNPTQRPVVVEQEQVPVFRVTVVGRTTPAINYRPRSGDTKIDFAGTPLMPRARGVATIRGQKGYIEVNADFNDLRPASEFGPEYLTYVVWASGGTGTVTVTAGTGCNWTASSNASWITVTGGASGSGNGTVTYSVAVYTGKPKNRNGTLTVAGQTVSIKQSK